MILPSKFPNLVQTKLIGLNSFELSKPKTKKINETTRDQVLNDCSLKSGQTLINKKTVKKTNPKLLFELISFFTSR